MHKAHDLLPHDDGGVGVGIRQHDLLRVVVAAPDDAGIIRRIAREPAVEIARGRAGLAGNGHVFQLRRRAGALFDGRFEHIGDIPRGHVLHGDVGFLRVVQNDLSVRILHNGVSPGLAPDALVGERGVSRRHGADRHASCEAAEGERPEVHVGQLFAVRGFIRGNERGQSHLVLGEGIAVFRRHLRHELDRDGIDRLLDSLLHGHEAAVGRVEVLGPGRRIGKGIRRIVHDGRGRDEAKLNGGRVDRDGLDDGAGGQKASCRTVPDEAALLFADASSQSDDIAGRIVDNDDAGLELLGAGRCGQARKILIDLIDGSLHIRVDGGIDLIAAGLDHRIDNVVFIAGLVAQVVDHVVDDLIDEPGVIVVGLFLFAAGIREHQLMRDGLVVLGLIDIALLEHLGENDLLPLLVVFCADIRVIARGVVGDADQRRALRQRQILDVLAEVHARGGLHAAAVFTERDDIQVQLHDLRLGVRFFEFQRAIDLDQLAAHGHLAFAGGVFDELLRDGRAAGLALAEEHFEAGAHRRDPVDALVLFKALVLDGDAGVDEVLGDIVVFDERAVRAAVDGLQHLILSGIRVFIIDDGGLLHGKAVGGPLRLLGQIVFYIDREQARKDQGRQKRRQKDRADDLPDHREDMSDASGSFSAVHVILFCHTEPPCLLWHTGRRRSAA